MKFPIKYVTSIVIMPTITFLKIARISLALPSFALTSPVRNKAKITLKKVKIIFKFSGLVKIIKSGIIAPIINEINEEKAAKVGLV